MALVIVTWWWGDKYGPEYLVRLANGIQRNLKEDYRFICITDRPESVMDFIPAYFDYCGIPKGVKYLTEIQGCLARLVTFAPEFQEEIAEHGDRIVSIDLDLIITGSLDGLFSGPDRFKILTGANSANPCKFNGSLWYVDVGYRPDVWADFNLKAAHRIPFYQFPDDQGWMAHKLPNAAGWKAGPESGVYAFQKPGWPGGTALPKDAKIVCFPGHRDPAQFTHLPWVRSHWLTS